MTFAITARPAATVSPSARRTPVALPPSTSDTLDVAPGLADAAVVRISRSSASTSFAPPPRGIGMPPSCTATAITCVM